MQSLSRIGPAVFGLVVSCVFFPSTASAEAPVEAGAVPIAAALPYPGLVAPSLAEEPGPALGELIRVALIQLSIDDETPEADLVDDVALLLRAATAAQLLAARGLDDADLRRDARTFAFFLDAIAWGHDTQPGVRASFARLPNLVPAASRPVAEALSATLPALRAYAASWFPAALAAEGDPASRSGIAWRHLARFKERRGELEAAAEAWSEVLKRSPDEEAIVGAYALFHELGGADGARIAAALRAKATAARPEIARRLDLAAEEVTRRKENAAWRASRPDLDAGGMVSRVNALLKDGHSEEAEALAIEALGRWKDEPAVWHLAAAIFQQRGRAESLRHLFADAEASGRLDDRLREFRIAALVESSLGEAMGGPPLGALREVFAADLEWLRSREGGPFVADVAAVLDALGRFVVAEKRGDAKAEGAELERLAAALLGAHGDLPDAWKVAIAIEAALGTLAKGPGKAAGRLGAKKGPAFTRLKALAARIEAAYALRGRDAARMKRALGGLDRTLGPLGKLGDGDAGIRYDVQAHRLLRETILLVQATSNPEKLDRRKVAASVGVLGELRGAIDRAEPRGRELTQAVDLAMAFAAFALDDVDSAAEAFRRARRYAELPLGRAIAASVLLVQGRAPAEAIQFLDRGLDTDSGDHARQYLMVSRAQAARMAGDDALAAESMAEALRLWDAAGLGPTTLGGAPRGIVSSSASVSVGVELGGALAVHVSLEPIVTLFPDFETTRADFERAVGP